MAIGNTLNPNTASSDTSNLLRPNSDIIVPPTTGATAAPMHAETPLTRNSMPPAPYGVPPDLWANTFNTLSANGASVSYQALLMAARKAEIKERIEGGGVRRPGQEYGEATQANGPAVQARQADGVVAVASSNAMFGDMGGNSDRTAVADANSGSFGRDFASSFMSSSDETSLMRDLGLNGRMSRAEFHALADKSLKTFNGDKDLASSVIAAVAADHSNAMTNQQKAEAYTKALQARPELKDDPLALHGSVHGETSAPDDRFAREYAHHKERAMEVLEHGHGRHDITADAGTADPGLGSRYMTATRGYYKGEDMTPPLRGTTPVAAPRITPAAAHASTPARLASPGMSGA